MKSEDKQALRLYKEQIGLIRKIANECWDPIGVVKDGICDEYDQYLPRLYQLVINECSFESFRDYVKQVEEESMGIGYSGDDATQEFFLCLRVILRRDPL